MAVKEELSMNGRMKQLIRYVLPTVGGLCVTYLYNIMDGIFVGQGVGAAAMVILYRDSQD